MYAIEDVLSYTIYATFMVKWYRCLLRVSARAIIRPLHLLCLVPLLWTLVDKYLTGLDEGNYAVGYAELQSL
jgi:hypothetical protein